MEQINFPGHEEAVAILEKAKAELEKIGFAVQVQAKEEKQLNLRTDDSFYTGHSFHYIGLKLKAVKSIWPTDSEGTCR
jgi:hypothetical protein